MGFVIGLALGMVIGYIGAYFQHHPERRAEIAELFKKKPGP